MKNEHTYNTELSFWTGETPPPQKNKNLENLSESHNLEKFTMHSGSISLTVSAPKSLMTKAAREPSMEGGENRFDYPTGT